MKYTVNSKQFEYFRSRCEYWKETLCVPYVLYVTWSNSREIEASVSYSCPDRQATVRLSRYWDRKPSNKELDVAAFHEIAHLLLSDIVELCSGIFSSNFLLPFEHAIIIGLENIVKKGV